MPNYSCNTASDRYYRLGSLVANKSSNNTYTYVNGAAFAFKGEPNFEKYKQEIAKQIPEMGTTINGDYVVPLPTEKDTVCINGGSNFLSIKSTHPIDNESVPVQITIEATSSELLKEAEQILGNSSLK
jgi:hypothetical protein